jgi:hypothetical protein
LVLGLVVSTHEPDRDFNEPSLLDSERVCIAMGYSDVVVTHDWCQLHIDELFDISSLVLFSQEEPLVVIES